jgi:hypothetical protein
MIQRLQSLYLLTSIILLSSLLSGVNLFHINSNEKLGELNVYGLVFNCKEQACVSQTIFQPFFVIPLVLIVVQLITLVKFKKLRIQLKWAQYNFLIYVLLGLISLIFWLVGADLMPQLALVTPGTGIFLFLTGIPFSFLAVKAIKKDKALIDSSDRIR